MIKEKDNRSIGQVLYSLIKNLGYVGVFIVTFVHLAQIVFKPYFGTPDTETYFWVLLGTMIIYNKDNS